MAVVSNRLRSAFTLIELMISIAMIVVLMVGVNQVFKMTSDAMGIGQHVAAVTRDARSAGAILQEDGRRWLKDSPIFYIKNERDPVTGLRHDYMAFFTRGSYIRQTPTAGSSSPTSSEAYMWIGHCSGGAAQKRNIVGRVAMLLKERDPFGPPAGLNEEVMPRSPAANPPDLSPLRSNWPTSGGNNKPGGRYFPYFVDQAETSIDLFRSDVMAVRQATTPQLWDGPNSRWWNCLVFRYPADINASTPPAYRISMAAPIFFENVTELIIEYAGDYVSQVNDPNDANFGRVTGTGPDGITDFVCVMAPSPSDPRANIRVRKTRWYGLNRDLDGNGTNNDLVYDTVPLYRLRPIPRAPFERDRLVNEYTCLWVNSAPTMVRMLMKVDDPSGRLQEGQWYEYILGPQ